MTETFIYFICPIGQDGPIKIGISENPERRLGDVWCHSPVPCELLVYIPGDIKLEQRFHSHFAEHHSHGEWFHASPDLTDLIAALISGTPIGRLIDIDAPVKKIRARRRPTVAAQYRIYKQRLRRAINQVKTVDRSRCLPPADVAGAMERWSGSGRKFGVPPTPAEMVRIEAVCTDPFQHVISWEERWPMSSSPTKSMVRTSSSGVA